MSNGFNPEKHINLVEEELIKAREVINNRNAVIRKLCSMFNAYGFEISGLQEIEHDEIIEID